MRILTVIDMQKDFIDGALGTKEAEQIVPAVIRKIKDFDGAVVATRDTHPDDYLNTQEGKNLPVVHCVEGSEGWQLHPELAPLIRTVVNKPGFGSLELPAILSEIAGEEAVEEICLIGLCTDICVISNAMILKAAFPETKISVDSACCAGVTPQSHNNALEAMKICQIEII